MCPWSSFSYFSPCNLLKYLISCHDVLAMKAVVLVTEMSGSLQEEEVINSVYNWITKISLDMKYLHSSLISQIYASLLIWY